LETGLTLGRNLVEMHWGNIRIMSAGIGKGSEFVIRLSVTAVMVVQWGTDNSNLGAPTCRDATPFDECVEGLSCFGDNSSAVEAAVQQRLTEFGASSRGWR
jgi:hypothetical protein